MTTTYLKYYGYNSPFNNLPTPCKKKITVFPRAEAKKGERENRTLFAARRALHVCLLQCGTHGNIHIIKANFKKAHCILALLITF